MAVTAQLVKELREITGAGMVDCKNVLTQTDGDLEKAIELLREKGLAAAAKKAGRIATEGLVYTYISEDGKTGVIVEVNSETDFVAKNQEFKSYVHNVAVQVASSNSKTVEELFEETWHADTTVNVKEALSQKIAVIGENLTLRRFEKFVASENEVLVSYIHGGGRVGVLLSLAAGANSEAVTEAGKNVCMQIAAMSPKFVRREEIPVEFIEKEKEILTNQADNEGLSNGKPANVVEKIITGRLNKNLKELCLLEQEYVKESDLTVGKYVESVAKEAGITLDVNAFVRYETGEGLEKKSEDFAEEVKKTMQG